MTTGERSDRVELAVVKGLIAVTIVCIIAAVTLAGVCIFTGKPLTDLTGIFVPLVGIGATAVGSLGTRRTRTDPATADVSQPLSGSAAPSQPSAGDRMLGDLLRRN